MLFRLVRPVRRKGTRNLQFNGRIPTDLLDRVRGMTLHVPVGTETVACIISAKATHVRLSVRSHDPAEVKKRTADIAAYLETVWKALRVSAPVSLTHKQATALAGDLFRSWSNPDRGRSLAVEHIEGLGMVLVDDDATEEEEAEGWRCVARRVADAEDAEHLEEVLGPIADRLLLEKGIAQLDAPSRRMLLVALAKALRDAFEGRARNAMGDYSEDPTAKRFPEWHPPKLDRSASPVPPASRSSAKVTLTGLLEDWWAEAQKTGRKQSTYNSYSSTILNLKAYLKHDDALRVTPEDIVAFKDNRLAKGASAKTVKDSDLAGLKTIFGWAKGNLRIPTNPAEGITIKVGRKPRLRTPGFTDEEATAILKHAAAHVQGRTEAWQMAAAKRWVPWLSAFSGARLGEMVQLRKQDVRKQGDHWVMRITPEAFTVKTNEARDVPLHPQLIDIGFIRFLEAAPEGHLFMTPSGESEEEKRGAWRTAENRVRDFVRKVVLDKNVQPTHGWRHRFKTVALEHQLIPRVVDALQGHKGKDVSSQYGEVTLKARADAIAALPLFDIEFAATDFSPLNWETGAKRSRRARPTVKYRPGVALPAKRRRRKGAT